MINFFNVDNMAFMKNKPDKYYDLAIVDPNQGKKEHGGKNRSNFVKQKNGSKLWVNDGNYKLKEWDKIPANNEYFDELFRVSKHQIIWGEQYFNRYFGKGRIIWNKLNGDSDQFDCEIAYNSLNDRVDNVYFMWYGMIQGLNISKNINEALIQQGNKKLNEKRIHPTQKPVKLYRWMLSEYATAGMKILDTHGGSMSSAIACDMEEFDLDICEIDKDYFTAGVKRFNEYKRQLTLF